MTVSSTANIVVYDGNGATTTFDYTFLIPAADDAVITYTDTAGVETVLNSNQYSITGIGSDAGGTVTYPLSGSPIANATFLSIRRELPLVQETDLVNQDGFYPEVVEDALDYVTMLIQQVNTTNTQAIRVPASESPPDELPAAALRANQALVFDSDGQPTVGSPSDATISIAMQPVAAASTLLSARALLGVAYLPSAVTTDQTIALADITTRYMATGALTFTMPDSTQVPAGFSFSIYALTADCIADPVGSDTIYGYSIGTSATVVAGTVVEFVTDGAGNWWPTTIIVAEDFVGAIRPYAGLIEPSAKYVLCDAASYLRSTYSACFTAISMSVTGTKTSGSAVIGGFTSAQTAKLAAGMLVEGTGIPSGSVILSNPNAGDTSITLDHNATNSTTQTVTVIPWGAADTTHFNVPDLRGRVPAGSESALNPAARLTPTYFGAFDRMSITGGLESQTLTELQMPTHDHTINEHGGHAHGGIVGTASELLGFGASTPKTIPTTGTSNPTVTTGITIDDAGSGQAHANVQPTLIVNYLIRVLP